MLPGALHLWHLGEHSAIASFTRSVCPALHQGVLLVGDNPARRCMCCSGPFEAGKPLSGGGLGLVKASRSSRFPEGVVVSGFMPWSTHFVLDAASQVRGGRLLVAC